MDFANYPMTRATLWATTTCKKAPIRIYSYERLKGCDAITLSAPLEYPYILVRAAIFQDPQKLDEILLHEFTHVVETMYCAELMRPTPEDCSNYARAIEKGFSEMLRNLKQI